jgi:hypothetical protein
VHNISKQSRLLVVCFWYIYDLLWVLIDIRCTVDPPWTHTTIMSILTPMQKLLATLNSLPPSSRKAVKTPLPPIMAGTVPSVPLELSNDSPSVFQVLNTFRHCWFLNRDHLIANVLAAQKDKCSRIYWVDFQPGFHTHLIHQAIALLPPLCSLEKGKHCIFIYILEVLTSDEPRPKGSRHFFELLKKAAWKRQRKVKLPSKASAPSKAAPPATPLTPLILVAVTQAILRSSLAQSTPPTPITLSHVEDILATSEMVQALHS